MIIVNRLFFLPFNITLLRNSARLSFIRPQVEELGSKLKQSQSEEEKLKLASQLIETFKRNRCHPYYNILPPLLAAPLFLSIFLAIERLCLHVNSLKVFYIYIYNQTKYHKEGGILWFIDLSSPDITWTLSVFSGKIKIFKKIKIKIKKDYLG